MSAAGEVEGEYRGDAPADASNPRTCPLPPRFQATADPKLRLLMSSMAECVRTIAYKARLPWRLAF